MEKVLENIAERWNGHAGEYDAAHHGHNTEEDINMWKKVLRTNLGEEQNVEVLDVGAGTGFLTLLISELGYNCTGLDISEGMLEIAKQHAKEKNLNTKFLQSTVEKLPFKDNSIDIITNRSLMWTLLTPDTILQEWNRALKPGGKLRCFITIGNEKMQGNHYDQEIEDMLPLKNASKEMLTGVLSKAGFTNVEAVLLDGIKNTHGNKDWYVIKGTKATV